MTKHCDYCREPFEAREEKQRFCDAQCREAYWNDERRVAMAELRRKRFEPGATYFGRTIAGIGIDDVGDSYIVGSDPTLRAPLPAPSYAVDRNAEPPLGEEVDALPDMTVEPYGGAR